MRSDDLAGGNRDVVSRPGWTTWLLIVWIVATAALYYYNFTSAFYEVNRASIQSLLGL